MDDAAEPAESERRKNKKSNWWWPLAVVASGLAGAAAVVAFRGCWHRKMSWPIRGQGRSYQVCLRCGAKRLFDEKAFRAYGPFRNSMNELIAWEEATKREPNPEENVRHAAP